MTKLNLRCARCGSNAVTRIETRRYACMHCGAEGVLAPKASGGRNAAPRTPGA